MDLSTRDGAEGPELLLDGEVIAPDALVKMPAKLIAALAIKARDVGIEHGVRFAIENGAVDARRAELRTIVRTVKRDDAGRITHVVEEGPL